MSAVTALEMEQVVNAPGSYGEVIPGTGKSSHLAGAGEYLSFRLGAEEYGIEILKVQEIRSFEEPTKIANATPAVRGVVNLRGVIVPIIDLRLMFNLPEAKHDALTVTIVLSIAGHTIGVVVDAVSDVNELKANQIRPAPHISGINSALCITGMGVIDDANGKQRMMILLDVQAMLTASGAGILDLGSP